MERIFNSNNLKSLNALIDSLTNQHRILWKTSGILEKNLRNYFLK